MTTMTIGQVAAAAGDRNATAASAGDYPVHVTTVTGKTRQVVSATTNDTGLVLITGTAARTLTVREILAAAGVRAAGTRDAGQYPLTVRTSTGKDRPVTAARMSGGLQLTTGK